MKMIKLRTVRVKPSAKPGTFSVYYYTFTIENFCGIEMYYKCTASDLKLAKKQLEKYMGSARYTIKSVSAAGPYIFYTALT